jgi:hypothetical protein
MFTFELVLETVMHQHFDFELAKERLSDASDSGNMTTSRKSRC